MKKLTLLIAALVLAGATSSAFADEAVQGKENSVSAKKEAHQRIIKLKDRIKNQRERTDQGVLDKTLPADQAQSDRNVLNAVDTKMKAEREANGSKKIMSKDQYDDYNRSLDANSASINEEKQDFYYYGPYVDDTPDYEYYYDADQAVGTTVTSVSTADEMHPRIFELKARIKNQRERIVQGLENSTLTADQAKSARDVLASVESQMKADYKSNGSKKMTRDQYNSYNMSLDVNSSIVHEQKHSFYYYGPYYNNYTYWF